MLRSPTVADLRIPERAIRTGFAENFRNQGGPGGAWRPLGTMTQRERQRQGFNPTSPILRRTGAYRRSWTSVGGFRDISATPTGWVLEVGSSMVGAFGAGPRGRLEIGGRTDRGFRVVARPVRYLEGQQISRILTSMDQMVWKMWKRV